MRAGKLDRRITIQRKSVTESGSGEPIETWADLATVWAQARPLRGDERFATRQLVGTAVMTFHIRYRGDLAITVKDRISYDGKLWDILDVREVGRHVVTEIDTKARADV
jgi:SPP1 family predicted phage head-tail adaptor